MAKAISSFLCFIVKKLTIFVVSACTGHIFSACKCGFVAITKSCCSFLDCTSCCLVKSSFASELVYPYSDLREGSNLWAFEKVKSCLEDELLIGDWKVRRKSNDIVRWTIKLLIRADKG